MALLLGPGGEFGFVMIGAALAGGLIDRALATTLVSAVALSMLAIPALAKLGATHRLAAASGASTKRPPEIPPESEDARVIIVGYGRVGALIGDMLDRHAIPFIAVDFGRAARGAGAAPTASRSITATPRGPNICAAAASRPRARSSSRWIRPPPTKRWSRRRAACGRT